ncbi:MAG: hypothetical protein R3300_17430, partial [Candidatus Promineifilaceae bacterium]|nr:hypothetical protein [Candidatus Promineifilaceae bacterium]
MSHRYEVVGRLARVGSDQLDGLVVEFWEGDELLNRGRVDDQGRFTLRFEQESDRHRRLPDLQVRVLERDQELPSEPGRIRWSEEGELRRARLR